MAIVKNEALADDLTDKLKTYQELKAQYLTQKQELKDEGLEQKSLTDPDSRRMKNNGSLDICYNVQSVVDAKNHFVVDISTTNDINDQNQLYTMAQKASELLEKESSTVLADTGYYNGTEIKNCVDAGMNVFIKKAKANNATKDNELFGTIKRSLGYSFFLRRRQENVDAEAASMFIAYNFKRLLSMFSTEELVTKFEESVK